MQTLKILYLALSRRCKDEHNYILSRFDRHFHTIKFIICYLLEHEPIEDYDFVKLEEDIIVASFNFKGNINNWIADFLKVGPGYFCNWYAYWATDSESNLHL